MRQELGATFEQVEYLFEFSPSGATCAPRSPERSTQMDHFLYRDGILHAEDVPLPEIAAAVGTPFYV